MQHSIWIDSGASLPQTRVLLAQCGMDPDTTHRGVREALDMWWRGEISPDYISDILYMMNMVNSDYAPYLDCVREALLRSLT